MGIFKKKVKGTMINPVVCKGCNYLRIKGLGAPQSDVANPVSGLTANCKAPNRVKKECKNWTTDLDAVERMFGMYDVASPESMKCVECARFDGGKCPYTKHDESGYAPRIDKNACLHFQHIKYVEGEAKVIE